MLLQQQQGQGLPQNQRTPTKKAIIRKEEPARQARYAIMGPFGAPGALFGPRSINYGPMGPQGPIFIYFWAPGAHIYLFFICLGLPQLAYF